jgi:hypothetical protein
LVGSLFLGFVKAKKRIAIEISYSDARSLATFSWVSYYDNRERVFIFAYDKKEKNIKTPGNLINTKGDDPLPPLSIACTYFLKL